MTRAVDLLKNKFGVSQLYKHDVIKDEEVIFSVYWHPLTIAEREAIQKKVLADLVAYETECDNRHVASKINEVKEDIRSLDINTLDDQTMTRFLTLCDLSEELRRK